MNFVHGFLEQKQDVEGWCAVKDTHKACSQGTAILQYLLSGLDLEISSLFLILQKFPSLPRLRQTYGVQDAMSSTKDSYSTPS